MSKEPDSNSALEKYYQHLVATEEEKARIQFPTYQEAIAELARLKLDSDNGLLQRVSDFRRGLTHKNPRGRPPKINLGSLLRTEKKNAGRPKQHTPEEMREIIAKFEEWKKLIAQKFGKHNITDNTLLKVRLNIMQDAKDLPRHKKQSLHKTLCKELKYFRDTTGIRQRKNSGKLEDK